MFSFLLFFNDNPAPHCSARSSGNALGNKKGSKSSQIAISGPALTMKMILDVSERIITPHSLALLGTRLKMADHVVQGALEESRRIGVTNAARDLLIRFRDTNDNDLEKLVQALREMKENKLLAEALGVK